MKLVYGRNSEARLSLYRVKPDFSDLEEKMDYYTAHPDEAQAIINHAHEYVEQFKDKQREDIISLMVLDKYFSLLKSKD